MQVEIFGNPKKFHRQSYFQKWNFMPTGVDSRFAKNRSDQKLKKMAVLQISQECCVDRSCVQSMAFGDTP